MKGCVLYKNTEYKLKALFIILILLPYWPVFGFPFVTYDDRAFIVNNPYFNPVTIENIVHFWRSSYEVFYAPVTFTLYAFLAWLSRVIASTGPLGEIGPFVFHATNVILHIINTLLVFVILRTTLIRQFGNGEHDTMVWGYPKKDLSAALGALIFALHPLQVESVAWVSAVNNLLSTTFVLLSVNEYIKYASKAEFSSSGGEEYPVSGKKPERTFWAGRYYLGACTAYTLALLAKPSAVVVPLILLLYDGLIIKRPLKKIVLSLSYFIVAAVVVTVITIKLQPEKYAVYVSPLWSRPFIAGDAMAFYLYKLVFPFGLALDYGRSTEHVLNSWGLYFGWLLPALIIVVISFRKDKKAWLVPAGIFVAGLLPVLGLVPYYYHVSSVVSDRYVYLSMYGIAYAFSIIFLYSKSKLAKAVCASIPILLIVPTTSQALTWRNDVALHENILKVNGNSAIAFNNLGMDFLRGGELDKAREYFLNALKHKPNSEKAYNNLGIVMAKKGNLDGAISYYGKALEISPMLESAHLNLGAALEDKGLLDRAIYHYEKAIGIRPEFVRAHYRLAGAFMKKGNYEQAIRHYGAVIAYRPNSAAAINDLGAAFLKAGGMKEAVYYFEKTLKIDPGNQYAKDGVKKAKLKEGLMPGD